MLSAVAWAKPAAIAAAVGLLAGLAGGVWATHEFYAPRLALAKSQVQVLGDRVAEQNESIEAAAAAEKKRAAAARDAVAQARKAAEQAQAEAMDILSRQPAPGVDRCTAASALVREELAK